MVVARCSIESEVIDIILFMYLIIILFYSEDERTIGLIVDTKAVVLWVKRERNYRNLRYLLTFAYTVKVF